MTDTKPRTSLFEPDDIIHACTDEDAIEDGFIIAIPNTKDRMTTAVFGFLSEAATTIDGPPPQRWPVPLMDWVGAKEPDGKALALAKGFIEAHRIEALASKPPADFYTAYFLKDQDSGRLIGYCDQSIGDATKVWLVPNPEVGGVTLMFPEDY